MPLTDTLAMEPRAGYGLAPPADEAITGRIHDIRGRKVMLDRDLAELYGVETKQLKRQVRRNLSRFPEDFMFELSKEENEILRSRSGTSSWGGVRYAPLVFTEQGVAMLSSVLGSEQAIQVSIHVIRVFARMREVLLAQQDLLRRLEALEERVSGHDEEIQALFNHLTAMVSGTEQSRRAIGFKPGES
jgi:hypothetical protein